MNKLADYISSKPVNKAAFARAIGTTPLHLQRLIKGEATPGIRLAYEIEKATDGKVTLYAWVPKEKKPEEEQEKIHPKYRNDL